MFRLSSKSKKKLVGLHPSLIAIVNRAIELSTVDFMVGEGVRTKEVQREYVRRGVSKTMNSRHIPASNKNGYGCAVDLWALNDVDDDGDLDINWVEINYKPISVAVKRAAYELGIRIEWGYDMWGWDSPHFQLSWSDFP